MKTALKKTLPDSFLDFGRNLLDSTARLGDWPQATFHPWRRDTVRRLQALKDSHRGERCFIIGNGPSLKQTDLSRLRGEAGGWSLKLIAPDNIALRKTLKRVREILVVALPRLASDPRKL